MSAPRLPFLAALAFPYAAVFGLAAASAPADRLALAAALAVPLLWLTATDIDGHEIPDTASAIIALAGLTYHWQLYGPTPAIGWMLVLSTTATAILWVAGGILYRRSGTESLGIGDAKLVGASALCVGAGSFCAMLLVASTGGIIAALLSRRNGGSGEIPFGPFLAFATFLMVLFPYPNP